MRASRSLRIIVSSWALVLAACGQAPADRSLAEEPTPDLTTPTPTPLFDAALIEQGRELYTHCMTYHGTTGLGLDEARLHFPESHRNCERCHRPHHSPTNTDPAQIFAVGPAGSLRDLAASGRFQTPEQLFIYNRATMPRWEPGRLTDEEYWAITAYIWADFPGAVGHGTPAPTLSTEDMD